ncbi:unnamed protein product, partial [Rotaria sp. Silwood1]
NNATTCEDKCAIESIINHLKSLHSLDNPSSFQLIGEIVNLGRKSSAFDIIIHSDAL